MADPSTGPVPRILIVEDHELLTQMLILALGMVGLSDTRAAVDLSVDGVLELARDFKPDIVLLDLYLGEGVIGLPMIAPLVEMGSTVLMLTGVTTDRPLLAECLEAGASGLFYKSQPFEQLVDVIRDAAVRATVMSPSAREALTEALRDKREADSERSVPFASLSHREQEVLGYLMRGLSAEEIARSAYISLATARSHIRAVLHKLGVNSQLAAVVLAQQAGWTPPGT